MSQFKKFGEALLIAGISFLLVVLFLGNRMVLPAWVQVIGRMHPLFLHFPIVLLLLYLATFWIPVKGSWIDGPRLLATLTAVITTIMGLLLSLEEPREGTTFFWHKWGGVAVALLAAGLYFLHPFLTRSKWVARPASILISFLLLFTGHWGAGLTHGEDYLLAPIASNGKENVPLDQALAFQHVILPLFESKCITCHSASNSKGGLVLDDTTGMLQGGKTGPLFEAGIPEKSLLIRRILLPVDDKKHMAPKAKPQLTEEEVNLLRAWVKAGAPLNRKVITLPVQDSFRVLAAGYLSPSAGGDIAFDFEAADEETIKSLNNNYRLVTPLGAASPALSVQFFGKDGYSPKALEELLKVKDQVTELSLQRLPVKDEDLKPVLQLKNLSRLNLNYTDLTEKGLLQLSALKKLKELALSGTGLTSSVAGSLAKLPELATIYAWNTALDSAGVAAITTARKGLKIETGYQEGGQTVLPLNMPVAKTAPGIYEPSSLIELKHSLRGAEIRYTLDESEPDSVNSAVYKGPIPLNKFTVVKARAFRQGWYGSKTLKAVYFTRGAKPDSVEYISNDPGGKGKESKLFDTEIGDLNLSSGSWQELKQPATYILHFKQPVTLRQVTLNTFVRMEWDIFPAAKFEVWGGMEKDRLRKLSQWQQPVAAKMEDPDLRQPAVSFEAEDMKFLKVVIHPVAVIPAWRPSKGKPSRVFISEIVLN